MEWCNGRLPEALIQGLGMLDSSGLCISLAKLRAVVALVMKCLRNACIRVSRGWCTSYQWWGVEGGWPPRGLAICGGGLLHGTSSPNPLK